MTYQAFLRQGRKDIIIIKKDPSQKGILASHVSESFTVHHGHAMTDSRWGTENGRIAEKIALTGQTEEMQGLIKKEEA